MEKLLRSYFLGKSHCSYMKWCVWNSFRKNFWLECRHVTRKHPMETHSWYCLLFSAYWSGGPNLSGPVLRDTARLSQRCPPIGVFGVSTWPFGCDTPSLFSERWRAWEVEVRYPPPPPKGYLSDTCAIPFENKAKRVRYPSENPVSVKFVSAILGPEMVAPILWAPRISACFLQENLHVHKIPRFGGGGYFGFEGGGGSADFIFIWARGFFWKGPRLRYYLERVLRDMGVYLALGR